LFRFSSNDFESEPERGSPDAICPDAHSEHIVKIGWGFEITMKLRSNRIAVQFIVRVREREPHCPKQLSFRYFKEAIIAAEIDDPCPVDVGPPYSILNRKTF
jgi:hypothetical protein